eukprot:scaffold13633_cov64-Phaeocystis_antarctica.AAC.13
MACGANAAVGVSLFGFGLGFGVVFGFGMGLGLGLRGREGAGGGIVDTTRYTRLVQAWYAARRSLLTGCFQSGSITAVCGVSLQTMSPSSPSCATSGPKEGAEGDPCVGRRPRVTASKYSRRFLLTGPLDLWQGQSRERTGFGLQYETRSREFGAPPRGGVSLGAAELWCGVPGLR